MSARYIGIQSITPIFKGKRRLDAGKALDLLDRMVANLIETHASELADCHAGDADLPGEAPEACSYCADIVEARELLAAAGRDTEHLMQGVVRR